jgi:competence protein ComGD
MNNSSGHTLVEMLIVLVVLTAITNIALVFYDEFNRMKIDRHFIETFSNDLLYAQQYAITNETNVTITINKQEHFYVVISNYFNVLKKVSFDPDIHFESGTLELTVSYNLKGRISKAGSFYMYTPKSTYKIVFNIGIGRFYVTRL